MECTLPHPILRDEASRLAALAEYEILDTGPERPFERMVRLVQRLLDVPIATVTFVDKDRQWFKARRGLDATETARNVSVCDRTIRSHAPMVVPDLRQDPRFRDLSVVTDEPKIVAYLGIPLVTPEGFVLGALCAMDREPRQFSQEQIEVLGEFAEMVVDWLEMRRMAQSDFLTGAMTRRQFISELDRELGRHNRHQRPCAIAAFDIDHFKRINDSLGHGAGDDVLKAVVATCQAGLRNGDILARIGGEEFCLLLPESDENEALEAAERMRGLIEAMEVPGWPQLRVTASFGLACYQAAFDGHQQWFNTADRELYRAKEAGRNRVSVAAPVEERRRYA